MKLQTIFILLILLSSCEKKGKKMNRNIEFFSSEVSKYRGTRKIIDLSAKFSECGEWGGHEENIFITTKADEKFHLTYQNYYANCDSMVLIKDSVGSYYAPFKTLVDSCSVIMNQNQMNSIYKFTHNLLDAKFRESFPGHAGDNFYLKKYDGFAGDKFIINFYGEDSQLIKDYIQLLKELNLPLRNGDIKKEL